MADPCKTVQPYYLGIGENATKFYYVALRVDNLSMVYEADGKITPDTGSDVIGNWIGSPVVGRG